MVAKITLFFAGLALADRLLPGKAYRSALQLVDVYTCSMGNFNEDGLSPKLGTTVANYCIIVLCSPTSLLVGTVWNLSPRQKEWNLRSTLSNISEWFIVATVSPVEELRSASIYLSWKVGISREKVCLTLLYKTTTRVPPLIPRVLNNMSCAHLLGERVLPSK